MFTMNFREASGEDSFLNGISIPGLKAYEALRGEKVPPLSDQILALRRLLVGYAGFNNG